MLNHFVRPNWPAQKKIKAFTTTNLGGKSPPPYQSLNLGLHVGDCPDCVKQNRILVNQTLGSHITPIYLNQVHGDHIAILNSRQQVNQPSISADASVTSTPNIACVAMTADCLPVLICNQQGSHVAALHCGWKGLFHNLINKVITQYFVSDECLVWFGPSIAQKNYEIDQPLRQKFCALNNSYEKAFTFSRVENKTNHYLFSLTEIAKQQCLNAGVISENIYDSQLDTFSDERFFSYRQSAQTGRIASFITIDSNCS